MGYPNLILVPNTTTDDASPFCPSLGHSLSPDRPQLYISQRWENNARKGNSQPRSNIPTKPSNLQRHRPRIPDLTHPNNRPRPSHQPSNQRCRPNRQTPPILPCRPVERYSPQLMKNQMLLHPNRQPWNNPITHKRQEIFENPKEMISSCHRANQFHYGDHNAPHPARDRFRIPTQHLDCQCRRIRKRRVARHGRQRQNDQAKGSETTQTMVTFEQKSPRGNFVCGGPARVAVHACSDGDLDDGAGCCTRKYPGPGQGEGEPFRGVGGIVDVEVGAAGAKAYDVTECEGEKRAAGCGEGAGFADERSGCVVV